MPVLHYDTTEELEKKCVAVLEACGYVVTKPEKLEPVSVVRRRYGLLPSTFSKRVKALKYGFTWIEGESGRMTHIAVSETLHAHLSRPLHPGKQ